MFSDEFKVKIHFRNYYLEYLLAGMGVLLVYFIPTLSHLIQFPLYFFEPMRIIVILSLIHSRKQNAVILAFTLPVFSFVISSHPIFIKAVLISFELVLNVFLCYFLLNKKWSLFMAIVGSVVFSKVLYYIGKFGLIKLALIKSNLISTPILLQVGMIVLFGVYAYLVNRRRDSFIF